nr:DUF1028 domain-containing protein [Ardenticatena sp.]
MPILSTFSIVAYDPDTQSWGVAVQSKFLAAGAVVPYAQADAGAVATQSYANLRYGPLGLHMMRLGMSAEETISALTAGDPGRAKRQVGVVDRSGRAAAFTGDECYPWAGHHVGDHFTCQGNILAGPQVVDAMFETFRDSRSEFPLRLIEALAAGQAMGGDRRGQQAAGLLVVRAGAGYGGFNDVAVDLRVDDHEHPIDRLRELYELHTLYFGASPEEEQEPLTEELIRELLDIAQRAGHYTGEIVGTLTREVREALDALMGTENLEMRWHPEEKRIDRPALTFLRKRFKNKTAR